MSNILLPSAAPEDAAIAQGIREAASDQGVSRAQLARKAGIKESRLERCWNDAGQLTMPEIARIAAALDVAPAYLFGDYVATEPVCLPPASESGVWAVPVQVMDRIKPKPGETVQVTTTDDPRGSGGSRFHISVHFREERLAWVSESGVVCVVGGSYLFLGTVQHARVTYALLGELPVNDGNRGA
jgi:transcriptional regulator with XRE-family HTH domain